MSHIDWSSFAQLVNQHQSFLLTSHIRPDCDALGSELGMAMILESLGKKVRIVNGHATPDNLAFIDPDKKIESLESGVSAQSLLADESFDVLMILDTSAWIQLGDMAEVVRGTSAQVVIVDHHVGEDDINALLFKNTSAEATGRLVFEAAEELGVKFDQPAATALFAAIATDTGWFRFDASTSLTYRVIADLMDLGASPPAIYGELYERETLGRTLLRGRAMSRVQCERAGKLAYTHVLSQDFAETGAVSTDTENLVNLMLAIMGTQVAVIFVEQSTGGFKMSFRSRCSVNCSEVAATFGGGGHKAAAGAFMEGTFDEVQATILPVVRDAMIASGE